MNAKSNVKKVCDDGILDSFLDKENNKSDVCSFVSKIREQDKSSKKDPKEKENDSNTKKEGS